MNRQPYIIKRDADAMTLLRQLGRISCADIQAKFSIGAMASRRTLDRLCADGHATAVNEGRRLFIVLKKDVAKPEPVPYVFTRYTPPPEAAPLRPGCQDFLSVPSLIQGVPTPRQAPIHGCVSSSGVFK